MAELGALATIRAHPLGNPTAQQGQSQDNGKGILTGISAQR